MPWPSPTSSTSASRSSSSQRRAAAASAASISRAVVRRHLARRRADGEVHARQQRVAEQHVEVGALAGEGRHQDGLELLAQVGGIGLARHVHQAGDEALVRVAPQEQAQALALAGGQDAQRGVVELVLADLEQVVARVGGQDVLQRLGQVAAFGQRGARTTAATFWRSSGISSTRAL